MSVRTSSTIATIPTEAHKISQFVKMRSQCARNSQAFHTMIKSRNQHCICLRILVFNPDFGEGNSISTMHFASMQLHSLRSPLLFSVIFLYQISLCLLLHLQATVSGILTSSTTVLSYIQCTALKLCLWVVCWSSLQVPFKNLSFPSWNTMKRSNCVFQWALKAPSWQMLIFMT